MGRILVIAVVGLVGLAFLPPLAADLGGYRPTPALVRHDGREVPLPDGRFLHVVDLAAREPGDGPPIVLVHGLPGTTSDWALTPERLAALGHRVVVYDRVGYGFSSREAEPQLRHTYASSAEDLRDLLDAMQIPEAILVGWSYGGGVVQQLAVSEPERVAGVVLIGSVGPSLQAGPADEGEDGIVAWLVTSPVGTAAFRWLSSIPPLADAVTGDALAEAFSPQAAIPKGFLEMTRAALELPGTFPAFVAEARNNDLSGLRPEAIDRPALVIHGTEDRLVPYEVGRALEQRLPQARLETVFDGSHMLPVTHPDWVARQIHALATGGIVLEAKARVPDAD